MAARTLALAVLLVTLAIIGVFLWAVIRPPAPVAPGVENAGGIPVAGEKRIDGAAGPWVLYAWAIPGANRSVAVTVSARDLAERPVASSTPPSAVLRMLDMAMGPERIILAKESPGFWRGSTQLSMAGRWSLQVDFNGESLHVPFEIAPR